MLCGGRGCDVNSDSRRRYVDPFSDLDDLCRERKVSGAIKHLAVLLRRRRQIGKWSHVVPLTDDDMADDELVECPIQLGQRPGLDS